MATRAGADTRSRSFSEGTESRRRTYTACTAGCVVLPGLPATSNRGIGFTPPNSRYWTHSIDFSVSTSRHRNQSKGDKRQMGLGPLFRVLGALLYGIVGYYLGVALAGTYATHTLLRGRRCCGHGLRLFAGAVAGDCAGARRAQQPAQRARPGLGRRHHWPCRRSAHRRAAGLPALAPAASLRRHPAAGGRADLRVSGRNGDGRAPG